MDPLVAVATGVQKVGVVAVVGATAAVFGLRGARLRAGAMVVAVVITPLILAGDVLSSKQVEGLRDNPGALIAMSALGVVAIAALAVAFGRLPQLFPLLAVAVLPFRVPLVVGDTSANLLVPLYLVVTAGCVSYVVTRMRSPDRFVRDESSPGRLELLLVVVVCLYALQSLYSVDYSKAVSQIVFFLVPFSLLLKLLLEVRWSARLTVACLGVVVAEALVLVGIGFWEYSTRHLLWNSKVIDANQFAPYFRVNSGLYDPNMYGRFLVVVILVLVAMALWDVRGRASYLLVVAVAALWGGLIVTFSQSSFAALLVGLAILAALRWSVRWTVVVSLVSVTLAIAFAVLFADAIHLQPGRFTSLNNATSGRLKLIGGGLELFARRPVWGYGSGSFSRKFQQERKSGERSAVSASHTTPVTVAAEQGLLGLGAYVLLLYVAFVVLLGGIRGPPASSNHGFFAARVAVAAAISAIVFHTMLYAAFLEDPFVWALIGVGLALSRQGEFVEAGAECRPPPAQSDSRPAMSPI